jgi:inorganic phosphate transporter, PiT family
MKKKSRSFVERHHEALQLATAVAFLLLVGLYA